MRSLIFSILALVLAVACSDLSGLKEGDHCNQLRLQDECNTGFTCTLPANCTQSVCCPNDVASRPPGQVNAACNACPPPEDSGAE